MSEESRRRQINNARDLWEKAGNVRAPTIKEYRDIPSYKDIEKASSAGVSVTVVPDVVLPTTGSLPGVVADIPAPSTTTTDNAPSLKFSGCWVSEMNPPSEGWTKLDMNVKVFLVRLQQAAQKAGIISGPIYVNSGWRSVQYNAKVGGSKSSQHLNGLAVDIVWDGFVAKSDKTNQFVALAKKEGFRGIGLYNTFVHLDIGPERQWDKRS
jgi:hypothetical protein